jgi:hypothetical protein
MGDPSIEIRACPHPRSAPLASRNSIVPEDFYEYDKMHCRLFAKENRRALVTAIFQIEGLTTAVP